MPCTGGVKIGDCHINHDLSWMRAVGRAHRRAALVSAGRPGRQRRADARVRQLLRDVYNFLIAFSSAEKAISENYTGECEVKKCSLKYK